LNRSDPQADFSPPFLLHEPDRQTAPFVFDVPHAGDVYPQAFVDASRLEPTALRRSEDAHVDRLFAGVTALGAPLLSARFPRAYLDVNREPYELDPRMFDGRLPPYCNTRSMRVAGGLGTVPRIVADGQDIYRGRLPVAEAAARIDQLYKPYHRVLRNLLRRTEEGFGHVVLIDCHSMPSAGLGRDGAARADIVLGDRYGTSCAPVLSNLVETVLRDLGYRVVRNKPYAGGFITEHYGVPAQGRHALQVEIARSLYMDEASLAPTAGFATLSRDLGTAFSRVIAVLGTALEPQRIAAE
jgi:N-formylglutamate amidohydrolase